MKIIKYFLLSISFLLIPNFSFSMEPEQVLELDEKNKQDLFNSIAKNDINEVKKIIESAHFYGYQNPWVTWMIKNYNEYNKYKTILNLNFTNSSGDTPLLAAIRSNKGNSESNLTNRQSTAIIKTLRENQIHSEIVKILLNEKNNLDRMYNNGNTALIEAVIQGNIKIVQLLIDAKANLNLQNNLKQTALISSTIHSGNDFNSIYQGISKLLIKEKANLDLQDYEGKTALHYAIPNGNRELFEYLINAGANINIQDNDNKTALHYTVRLGNESFIKKLVLEKANLDLQDKNGNTPLIIACSKINFGFINLLINAEANLNKKNKENFTAYKILEKENDLLDKKFANISKLNYLETKELHAKDLEILFTKSNILKKIEEYKNNIYQAIELNNLQEFKINLLKVGSICFKDKNGNNLLHKAIMDKNTYMFGLILSINPDLIDQKNNKGQTPIELAIAHDQNTFQLIKKLCLKQNLNK